jgi:integrase
MPDLATAIEVRDWLMRRYSTETCRRMMQRFSACCEWSIRSKFIRSNPFEGLEKDFRKSARGDRRSFLASERDLILESIDQDLVGSKFSIYKPSHYLPYLKFLFWTGCRVEEANGLRWQNVTRDCSSIRFCEALPADTRILGDTKTHIHRDFPANQRLVNLLKTLDRGDSFVFLAPKGGPIDSHNVLNRTWRPTLEELVDNGQIRAYLPLKHCRHTFITLALEAGLDSKDIGPLVGNSPEVIYRHYAARKPMKEVPIF